MLHIIQSLPGAILVNHLGLVQPVEGLSQRIVVSVTYAANRCIEACLCQPFGIADREILAVSVAVVDNAFGFAASPQRLLKRVQD